MAKFSEGSPSMDTPWILGLLALGLALVVGAYLAARSRRAMAQEVFLGGISFALAEPDDVPDDAAAKQRLAALQAERARLTALPPDELIALLLEDPHPDRLVGQTIRARGAELAPHLLEAVFDPRFRGGSFQLLGQPWEPRLTALMLYAPHTTAEAVPRLAPLVADPSQQIRNWAGRALGLSGAGEATQPLLQLLAGEDGSASSSVLAGIRSSIGTGRATPEFKAGMFDAVAALAFRGKHTGDAAACLLELDRASAVPLLLAEERLQVGQENLFGVLEACLAADVRPPAASSLRLAAALGQREGTYFEHRALSTVLQFLASEKSPAALAAIERGRKHPAREVREGAAKARARAAGMPDPFKAAFDRWAQQGWQSLTEPQRHVLGVRTLINEVTNGGLTQYFENSYSDHWRDAAAGLTAIGALRDGALFEQALGKFGDTPPSTDQEQRGQQLSALFDEDDDPGLDALSDEILKDPDDHEVLLLEYVIEHAEDFRSVRAGAQ